MADEDQNSATALAPSPPDSPNQSAQGQVSVETRSPFPLGGQVYSVFPADYIEERQALDEKVRQAEIEARMREIVRSRFPTEIGEVVAPSSNVYAAYRDLHDYGIMGQTGYFPIQYNAFQFGLFDGTIATALEGDKERKGLMSNENHEDYASTANLRRNIAILRNILYVEYFGKDGYQSFIPSDAANAKKLEKMAEMLGDALAKGKNGTAPGFNSLSMDEASQPDTGVVAMYNYLANIEKEPWHRPFFDNIKSTLMGDHTYDWKLKPIDETALSDANMKASDIGIRPVSDLTPDTLGEKKANVATLADLVNAELGAPEKLEKPVRDEAIYLAMKILNAFWEKAGSHPQNANLAVNEADEFAQMKRILDVYIVYKDIYSKIVLQNPDLKQDPAFQSANNAMCKLVTLMKEQALEDLIKEGSNEKSINGMKEIVSLIPKEHNPQSGETFDVLMGRLQMGLERVALFRSLPGPWMKNATPEQAKFHENILEAGNYANALGLKPLKDTIATGRIVGTNSPNVSAIERERIAAEFAAKEAAAGLAQQPSLSK